MRLSQDELLLVAYFRSLDARGRAPLVAAAHSSVYEPVYERVSHAATSRLIPFPARRRTDNPNHAPPVGSAEVSTLIRRFRHKRVPDTRAPIFVTDAAGTVRHANAALRTLLEIPPRSNCSTAITARVHPDDRAELHRFWAQCVSTGATFKRPVRYVLTRGAILVADVDAHPFFGRSGQLQGYCGTVSEISTMMTGSVRA